MHTRKNLQTYNFLNYATLTDTAARAVCPAPANHPHVTFRGLPSTSIGTARKKNTQHQHKHTYAWNLLMQSIYPKGATIVPLLVQFSTNWPAFSPPGPCAPASLGPWPCALCLHRPGSYAHGTFGACGVLARSGRFRTIDNKRAFPWVYR